MLHCHDTYEGQKALMMSMKEETEVTKHPLLYEIKGKLEGIFLHCPVALHIRIDSAVANMQ